MEDGISATLAADMRIGIVTYDYDPPIGGLGVHVQRLVATLERLTQGDDFLVFSPSRDSRMRVSLLAQRFWRKRGGAPVFSLSLFLRLPWYIRRHKLDLVHAQCGSGGVILLRRVKVPLIVTSHHTYMDEAIVYRKKPLTYFRKRLLSMLERRTYRIADTVICVSKDTRQTVIDRYRIDSGKVMTIENSIALDRFEGEGGAKQPGTILYIGRLEPRKGLPILLEAFALVRKKHSHAKLRIIGENMLGSTLQRMAHEKEIHAHTEFLGHVSDEEYVRELRGATMLVVPSIIEGFGLAAAEAMAAGTTVVASGCPGLKSVVTHEKTGLLFATGDAAACAEAINRALENPDDRKKWEKAARDEAWERFAPVRQAKQTLAVYAKGLKSESKS